MKLTRRTAFLLSACCFALLGYILALPAPAADYRAGPYAGLEVGAATEQLSTSDLDFSKQGLQVGGVAGWTFRTADLVFGLEGAFGWNGVTGKWGDGSAAVKSDGSWRGALRARGGVPFGPALIFISTGPTFQQAGLTISSSDGSLSDSKLIYGIAAGAGVDLQITNTMVVRIAGEHTWWKGAVANFGEAGNLKTSSEDTRIVGALIFNLN